MTILAVAVGGGVGAVCRWLLSRLNGDVPWGTLAANLAGSLLIGLVLAMRIPTLPQDDLLGPALATGFCGGLTTLSTLMVEVTDGRRVRWGYLAVTVAGCLLAAWVGLRLGGSPWR